MELISTLRTCQDETFAHLFDETVEFFSRCVALYSPNELVFSFNGGKDCTVVFHLLRAALALHYGDGTSNFDEKLYLRQIHFIYFKEKQPFPEIEEFIRSTSQTYQIQIETVEDPFKQGTQKLVTERGIKAFILGQRRGDPYCATLERCSPSSRGWAPFMRLNPILDWTYANVWTLLRLSKVEYCRLYDVGYTSLGGLQDTFQNPSLSDGAGGYHPAYALLDEKQERHGRSKR
eukprot:TRINITY_DN19170_c0_g1::TRINITY_DN19170_c0_g1_i1::g.2340::m.2340 TRINITY_DN19170_c0_g1::TRINITY_DN19170_c0_g1_i1::g.2340  ORF type:complete len:233 (+),score=8.10,sp/Q6ING7/FLAD1_XENLA/40.10/1e-44,PAPS_reduct/PF01507.14/2.8e+03,PAPS_reduct/PF01507.14/1.2e-21 TRINITY_DN19170_c0_g1_i1:70-768(+)